MGDYDHERTIVKLRDILSPSGFREAFRSFDETGGMTTRDLIVILIAVPVTLILTSLIQTESEVPNWSPLVSEVITEARMDGISEGLCVAYGLRTPDPAFLNKCMELVERAGRWDNDGQVCYVIGFNEDMQKFLGGPPGPTFMQGVHFTPENELRIPISF